MDLLKDKVKPLFFRYLAAAFGSALTSSIYSVVDMAMVGQYQGPDGTAALAVVAPVWNIIYSFGLLAGIGGSVLFSTLRGSGKTRHEDENEYFTTALGLSVVFAALWWIVIAFFDVAHAAAVRRVGRAAPARAGLCAADQVRRAVLPV